MKLAGKTALITGATGGFGERIAMDFAKEGATLILHGRSEASLKALQTKLAPNALVTLLACDLLDKDFIPALKECIDTLGGIDIVVNNAAEQGPIGKSWEVNPVEWAQTIHVNLLMPVSICQLALPTMIKRKGGKIINISGGGASGSRPGYSAYAAAKTALVRFTECLADEAREHHIDINAIAPGVMPTRMHPSRTSGMPADPFAEPVALCAYLASQMSNGVSGRLISAVWDDWHTLHRQGNLKELYTLRRLVPKENT